MLSGIYGDDFQPDNMICVCGGSGGGIGSCNVGGVKYTKLKQQFSELYEANTYSNHVTVSETLNGFHNSGKYCITFAPKEVLTLCCCKCLLLDLPAFEKVQSEDNS